MKKYLKKIIIILLVVIIAGTATVWSVDFYVKNSVSNRIITAQEAMNISDADCILVFGCGVKKDGTPSDMLSDRIKRGIELYNGGAAPKIIMSGDHGRKNYNEVGIMKQYAVKSGIDSEDVFMDHAGFSTYESLYRARDIFEADKIIIVSQKYHLYRALYIARTLGLEVYGVDADYHYYRGQAYREIREVAARCKDFIKTVFMPEPTYLGEAIPVSGDGDLTND